MELFKLSCLRNKAQGLSTLPLVPAYKLKSNLHMPADVYLHLCAKRLVGPEVPWFLLGSWVALGLQARGGTRRGWSHPGLPVVCFCACVCGSGVRVLVVWWIACKTFVQCLHVDSDDVDC